jgi:Tetratricopeptide Repeats-Sensor
MVDGTAKSAQTRAPQFRDTPEFVRSREVRNGAQITAGEALDLAKKLRNQLALGESRRLVEQVRKKLREELKEKELKEEELKERTALDFELLRVQVTCTYKDAELPPEVAFTRALQLLRDAGHDPETTTKPEALGLAGAIWKRWWEYDGQRDRLTRSLAYYEKGYGSKVTTDDGYQAINAAYVLDLLASLELGSDQATADARKAAENRRKAANEIRQRLVAAEAQGLPDGAASNYWYQATIAEAHLGLHQLAEAEQRLRDALGIETAEPWMRESTARQLAGLVVAHHAALGDPSAPAWRKECAQR